MISSALYAGPATFYQFGCGYAYSWNNDDDEAGDDVSGTGKDSWVWSRSWGQNSFFPADASYSWRISRVGSRR